MGILETSVIGSYAWPTWYVNAVDRIKSGDFGDKDAEETMNDAVDLAIRDQEEAGVDIISDGEMRRFGFFTAGFYGWLEGLAPVQTKRKYGPGAHDQREKYEAVEEFTAPNGLGLVDEYKYAHSRTSSRLKVPCAGPYTLAGRIEPGKLYGDRMGVAHRFAELINKELKDLVAAGADFIQLDEPSYAVHKHSAKEFIELFNKTIEGVDARISVHLCFGNYIGRPTAHRTYEPILEHILQLNADELAMEFANRELSQLEMGKAVVESGKTFAAGLVDVKNTFVETPEIVADRVRKALNFAPPDKLVITPDCGFSQTARYLAKAKMESMVKGVEIVRNELTSS